MEQPWLLQRKKIRDDGEDDYEDNDYGNGKMVIRKMTAMGNDDDNIIGE